MYAQTSYHVIVNTPVLKDNTNAHLHTQCDTVMALWIQIMGQKEERENQGSEVLSLILPILKGQTRQEWMGLKMTDRQTDSNLLAFRSPTLSSANGSTLV